MSMNDIRPWLHPNGGHSLVQHFRLAAGQTFVKGEPVRVNNAGALVEIADEPVATGTMPTGIALAGPGDGVSTGVYDTTNPRTGAAWATGDLVPVLLITPEMLWLTPNVSINGTAFAVGTTTLAATLAQPLALRIISGVWGIESDESGGLAANANVGRIMDLLDENYRSIQKPGLTGKTPAYAVFSLLGANVATAELLDAGA